MIEKVKLDESKCSKCGKEATKKVFNPRKGIVYLLCSDKHIKKGEKK